MVHSLQVTGNCLLFLKNKPSLVILFFCSEEVHIGKNKWNSLQHQFFFGTGTLLKRDVGSSDILGSYDILTVDLIKWAGASILWLLILRHHDTQEAL